MNKVESMSADFGPDDFTRRKSRKPGPLANMAKLHGRRLEALEDAWDEMDRGGKKFQQAEETAREATIQMLQEVAIQELNLRASGWHKRAMDQLREELGLQPRENQKLPSLILRRYYGFREKKYHSTASRHSTVILHLLKNEVAPKHFAQVVEDAGGLDAYGDRARQEAKGIKSTDAHPKLKGKLALGKGIGEVFAGLEDGDQIASIVISKRGSEVKIAGVSLDAGACAYTQLLLLKGRLDHYIGTNPEKLNVSPIKVPMPLELQRIRAKAKRAA